ncbi:MAG: hypothetical protein JEZ05_05375 [Tenericutes bacterium]|nr:hypothetical protein [Mycoplasmatota bacterium]
MSNIFKKILIVLALSLAVFTTVHALQLNLTPSYEAEDFVQNYPFIEDAKLASSRYTQPADETAVNPDEFLEIDDRDDVLIAENNLFKLYYNEEIVSFKILDKVTNYVWSTAIDSPNAGTYTGLLSSGIGIEYVLLEKDMFVEENIGISDIAFTQEQTLIENGIKVSLDLGGYCATRLCTRMYERYLDDDFTLEEMIEMGYTEINVGFDLEVTLTEQGIEAYIPIDSIREGKPEEITLSSIILFPGLGATEMDNIPGYMVIPDGAGALIRYEDNNDQFNSPYEERFYGDNMGLEDFRTSATNYPLSMPIFGAVHGVNQNGFIGIIESGDFNARLFAYPNGAHNLPYNVIFPKFDIQEVYRQSFSSDGTGGTLKLIQSSYDDIDVVYNFLNGSDANYVGIGENYRSYLEIEDVLEKQTQSGDISIFLNYLMSDSEASFFGNTLVEMSSVAQVLEMYDYFILQGLENQNVGLMGWNTNGYSGELPADVNFENALGSNRAFRNLIEYINEENSVLLVNNYIMANGDTDGISYAKDVAKGTNRFKIQDSHEMFTHSELYILYPFVTNKLAQRDYEDYLDEGVGVLFESLANNLYSYYENGDYYFRSDSYAEFVEVMELYEEIGSYYYPFSYSYKYANAFYEAPLYNSQLKYFDDLVPLLQVVLKGSIDMYASALNYNSLGKETILNLIDFGMNPSYVLTYEPASLLKDTDLKRYFTTEFSRWKDTIVTEYEYINNALKYVNGEYITARIVLDFGVVMVSYSNGVDIYINYTSSDYTDGLVTVEAMDYYVGGVS